MAPFMRINNRSKLANRVLASERFLDYLGVYNTTPVVASSLDDSDSLGDALVLKSSAADHDAPAWQGGYFQGNDAGYFDLSEVITLATSENWEIEIGYNEQGDSTGVDTFLGNTTDFYTRIVLDKSNDRLYIFGDGTGGYQDLGTISDSNWHTIKIIGTGTSAVEVNYDGSDIGDITIGDLSIQRLFAYENSGPANPLTNQVSHIKITQAGTVTNYWDFNTSNRAGDDMATTVFDLVGDNHATGQSLTPASNAGRTNSITNPILNTKGWREDANGFPIPAKYDGSLAADGNALTYKGRANFPMQFKGTPVITSDASYFCRWSNNGYINLITGDFTVCMFVSGMSAGNWQILLDYLYVDGSDAYGFAVQQKDTEHLCLVVGTGSGATTEVVTTNANLLTDGAIHSIVIVKESGTVTIYVDGNSEGSGSVGNVVFDGREVLSLWSSRPGASELTPNSGSKIWNIAILNSAFSSAQIAAYHEAGVVPSSALFIPMEANYLNGSPVAFQESNAYVGTQYNYTPATQWANTVDHASAFYALRNGFQDETTYIKPADASGNIPGTTTPVSNPAVAGHNDAPLVTIDENPLDCQEVAEIVADGTIDNAGANEFGDTWADNFSKTQTSVAETKHKIKKLES